MPRPFNYKSAQAVQISGFNPDIDNNDTPTDVWPVGGIIPFAETVGQVTVVSDAANDAFGGPGAQVVQLRGITDSYEEFTEDVPMDGATPVATVRSDYLHVQDALVIQSGSGNVNEGVITCELQGDVVNAIAAARSQAQSSAYVVPVAAQSGQVCYLVEFNAMASKQANVEAVLGLVVYDPARDTVYTSPEIGLTNSAGLYEVKLEVPVIFPPGTRIVARVIEVSGNNVRLSASYQLAWW